MKPIDQSVALDMGDASAPGAESQDGGVDAARQYLEAGWAVVPVEPSTKSPKIKDWPEHAAARAWSPEDFAGMNVGVVLGHVSRDLVDIDLDSPLALRLAPAFLPPTLTFGRESKPASHWLYYAPGVRSAMHWFRASDDPKDRDLIEVRSTNASADTCGHQSVFPGSTHESGESVRWEDGAHEEPQAIDGAALCWAVARLTVACIVLRDWHAGSSRRTKALCISAGLLKQSWTADEVRELFEAVQDAAGDSDAERRDFGHQVETTIEAVAAGREVQGYGTLVEEGIFDDAQRRELERHARTPAQRLRDVKFATTGPGAGARARMVAEARAVDGIASAAALVAKLAAAEPANETPPEPANDDSDDGADPWSSLGVTVDFTQEAEPLDYLVEGLPFAPGGKVNALAGPPKGGKSPFALLLAVSVATGRPFLDRRILQPGPVLYLDAETGQLAHVRYRRICRALDIDPTVVPLEFRNVDAVFSEKYLSTLQGLLEASPKRLVVIDTYGAMLEGGIDYNSPDFAHYLKQLGRMSRRLKVVIVVLIHEKKSGGRTANGLEMISGSFAAAGAMQGVVSLRPEGESNDAAIVVSCSRAPEDDFRPFRMRWNDVAAPAVPTSPGDRIKAQRDAERAGAPPAARWGLRAELVEGDAAPAVAAPRAAHEEDALRRICEHLAAGPSTLRQTREAVAKSFAADRRAGVGKDRLAQLVGLLVERGNVVTSVQSTSKQDVTWYSLRAPV